MKKLIGFLLLIFVFTGCDSKDEIETEIVESKDKYAFDSSDIKMEEASDIPEKFSLDYRFQKDKLYKYRVTSLSSGSQEIISDTTIRTSMEQNGIYLLDLKLLNIDSEDIMELSCNITSVKVDIKGDMQSLSYESETTKDSSGKAQFAEYHSLINTPFNFRVSKYGEVVEIYKTDKILSNFLKLRNIEDSVTVQDKDYLKNQMTEGLIKSMLVQLIRKMPEKDVPKDSLWQITQPVNKIMVFDVKNISTFKVSALQKFEDDNIAVIDAGLIATISGNNKETERGLTYNFETPKLSGDGTIYFNITDGMILKSKTRTTVETSLTMEANTPQGSQKGTRKETVVSTNIVELL